MEGRRLLDHFASAPYGWSRDTTRYLLAAAFMGGEIKLRISGKDHQVKNDETLAAMSSNKAIGPVGIALREEKVDPEACMRACERLQQLSGDLVMPLEDDVAAAAKRFFPAYQSIYGPLAVELRSFDLTSAEPIERMENLTHDLAEILSGDGSDAVKRMGSADSPLFDSLVWARKLKNAMDNGLRQKLAHIRSQKRQLDALPSTGQPGKLKAATRENFAAIEDVLAKDAFFEESATLGTVSAEIDKLVASSVAEMAKDQTEAVNTWLTKCQSRYDWLELDTTDREWVQQQVAQLPIQAEGDLDGLKALLNRDYEINHRLPELERHMAARVEEARAKRQEQTEVEDPAPIKEHVILLRSKFRSAHEIESLIKDLTRHLEAIKAGAPIQLVCKIIDGDSGS